MDKQKLLNFALIVVLTMLFVQIFNNKSVEQPVDRDDLVIQAKTEISTGTAVILKLQNNTSEKMVFASDCPAEPFSVSQYTNGEWVIKTSTTNEKCSSAPIEIPAHEVISVSYQPWQHDLFAQSGKYRVQIPLGEKAFFHEIKVNEPGLFRKIGRTLFYTPIYNGLIFFTKISNYSFGWGIVILTLLVRLILFVPFQKSLKSQRKMQKIQPELNAIKKRFEGNQQMIAMETVALMKKHKISPLSSCLPILIQMPFLLALFWATRDGLGENNFVFLYDFLRDFDFAGVATHFMGLDLVASGAQFYFVLPVLLAVTQFSQMKLAMHHAAKNKPKKSGTNPMEDAMQSMTKMMPYFLPLMIAFFSASMPAAVGIYWGTSTVFGLAQQLVVNRQIK